MKTGVVLIRVVGNGAQRNDNERAWKAVKGDINIEQIDDTHGGLVEHAEHYPKYLDMIELSCFKC